MTPEQQDAMLEAGLGDERLREFERKRSGEDARLQGQLGRAYDFMNSPLQPHGNTTGALMANTLANALRSFGGLYLANRGEGQLSAAQAAAEAENKRILGGIKKGRGAAMDAKKSGLGRALLYGRDPVLDPAPDESWSLAP